MTEIKHIQIPRYAMKMTKKEIYIHGYSDGYAHARLEYEKEWAGHLYTKIGKYEGEND